MIPTKIKKGLVTSIDVSTLNKTSVELKIDTESYLAVNNIITIPDDTALSTGTKGFVLIGDGELIEEGYITVEDLIPSKTHNQTVLENINKYLENPNSIASSSYSIQGRSLSKYQFTELLALKDKYSALVDAELKAKRGKKQVRKVQMRFV